MIRKHYNKVIEVNVAATQSIWYTSVALPNCFNCHCHHVKPEFHWSNIQFSRQKRYQSVLGTAANTRYTKTNPRYKFGYLYVCRAIRTSRGSSVIPLIGRQNRFNPNITNRSMTFDIYDAVIRIEIFQSRDGGDGALFSFGASVWTFLGVGFLWCALRKVPVFNVRFYFENHIYYFSYNFYSGYISRHIFLKLKSYFNIFFT